MHADCSTDCAPRDRGRSFLKGAAAWGACAAATLAVLWPLGLTNRILAGVDAFTYFLPYWAYRIAELRAGQIPLWNPYLFLGVPFLANPQAAVLYPLHWPLTWLPASRALIWSALLHIWLAAGFTYVFARRSLGLSRLAAWLAAVLFALGGFSLARVENINQLNVLTWLPASFWLLDEAVAASCWRGRLRWGAALVIVLTLQLLAGHTQTFFINQAGLGLYASWPLLRRAYEVARKTPGAQMVRPTGRFAALPIVAIALLASLLLGAGQLLPTVELNRLGLRTGGLPYREAVSFSLRPRLLAQTFLPPFAGGLAEAFGSEGYAEFAGWIGVAGLGLAGVGAAAILRGARSPKGRSAAGSSERGAAVGFTGDGRQARGGLLLLAAAGLFLALGAYNPIYYLLWRFVPGFDLFRAPVRWLALYALGMAGLAGVGLDVAVKARFRTAFSAPITLRPVPVVVRLILLLAVVALAALQQWPPLGTLLGWAATGALTAGLLLAATRWPAPTRAGLIALTLAELWLAGRALPFVQATAPMALSLRNAPAALLVAADSAPLSEATSPAEANPPPRAGRARFLSMSDIRYDPGDLAELRALQADRLPQDAVERAVRAAKQTEVLAPNLPLLWQLPAVDGYDGGVLPLDRYVKLQGLFLPPELLWPDGRLREQLAAVPEGRLLDLTGVRFVITDKQRDLWADDIYYDLQIPARLEPGQTLHLDLTNAPAFVATELGLVVQAPATQQPGAQAAKLIVASGQVPPITLTLPTRPELLEGNLPVRVSLPQPLVPTGITVHVPADSVGALTVRGLSLIDRATGTHASVTVSPRGDFRRIHSGDVKVYERVGAPGRAWLVHGIQGAADDAAALDLLRDPAFDPRVTAIVTGDVQPQPPGAALTGETLTTLAWEPERIVVHARVAAPALLVLADSFYPGWQASVDGSPTPILQTNFMFRGVAVGPGDHEVVLTYRPISWRAGVVISLTALGLLLVAVMMAGILPKRQR